MTQSNEVPFLVLGDADEIPQVGVEVAVYAHDDPTRMIDVLPVRWDVTFLDEIARPGGGSFTVPRGAAKVLENPDILDWRNLVRLSINHQEVGAFLLGNKVEESISSGEHSAEVWKVSGEGLRSWFHDAVVLPYRGLKSKSAGSRVFSFASERGAWYNPAQWKTPVKIQQHNLDPNSGPWNTAPAEWPDVPQAWWVWGTNNSAANPASQGYNYFRYEFTIPESEGVAQYSVFAAGDDMMQAYVDGQNVIDAQEAGAWTRTSRADFELSPGEHVLAFRVHNTASSPAGLIAALFRVGDAALGTAAQLLTCTGSTGWTVNPYPDPAPGWTAGEIMLTLLKEAKDRGVRFPTFLSPTFTAAVDSEGAAWSRALDWEFTIGMEYFEVVERLEEAVCDLWINPATLELNMYAQRGVERVTQSAAVSPVILEAGKNLLRARKEGKAQIKNVLALSTTDGWRVQGATGGNSLSKYGRIEGTLATGLSPAVSGDVADSVFRLKAEPTMAETYEIVDVEFARPFVDFHAGDWVLVKDDEGHRPIRVLSLSVSEDDETGEPTYAVEFGTIYEDQEQRHERWLRTLSANSLGGTVSNAGGSSGSSASGSPSQAPRTGPPGLPGMPGPPGLKWRGVWSEQTTYETLDAVTHDGSTWLAEVGSVGVLPGANASWTVMAGAGGEGPEGPEGPPGPEGPSAYEAAVALGFTGTSAEWLESLRGETGLPGTDGSSAYDLAVAAGFAGTPEEWLLSLRGPEGLQGPQGEPGHSFRGAWSSETTYGVGDSVQYADALWATAVANTNTPPGTDDTWLLINAGGGGGDASFPPGGVTGQALVKASDTDGDVAWGTIGGGGGGFTRGTTVHTTVALASGATEAGTLELAPGFRLLRISADRPARVRFYTNAAKRDADVDRPLGVKPTGDHGRLFEAVTTVELPAFDCSPAVDGFTEDGTSTIPYSVTSTGSSGGAVTLTLLWIRTE